MNEQTKTSALRFEDRDEFGRKLIAENLIQLLTSEIQISPMVIDGQWGTGKTEFCHKLENLLKETHPEIKTAYIDAFKADHANEPLMTLIAEISNLIEDEKKASDFKKAAIPAIRYGLKTLGKAGVTWVLKKNADDIADELKDVMQKVAEDSINTVIKQTLKDHSEIKETLSTLQEALEEIAKDVPLILFIDELDRCKPDFAIAMLENIKHVFDVPNVHFVLVSNLKQLKDSIKHCYGIGVNAQKYLDKFIRYSLQLPADIPYYNKTLAAVRHAEGLIEKSALLENDRLSSENRSFGFIETLIKKNELSLREVESLVRHLEIYQRLTAWKFFECRCLGVDLLRLIGVYIYCFEKDISGNLISGKIDTLAITGTFGIQSFADADWLDNIRPKPQQAMASILMLENPDGVEGVPDGGIYGYYRERIDLIKPYLPYEYINCENCVEVIADTVRILRLDDTGHRDRVLKNLDSSAARHGERSEGG